MRGREQSNTKLRANPLIPLLALLQMHVHHPTVSVPNNLPEFI